MATDSGLLAYLLESLAPLGGVTARRMFGGHGLIRQGLMFGLMFGLVFGDDAYFKVDDANRPAYAAAGSGPFTYTRAGKPTALGFWLLPGAVLDAPDMLCDWARQAVAVALRAAAQLATKGAAKRGPQGGPQGGR